MPAACSSLLLHAQCPWVEQLPRQVMPGDNSSRMARPQSLNGQTFKSDLWCREPWMMACFQMMPHWGA